MELDPPPLAQLAALIRHWLHREPPGDLDEHDRHLLTKSVTHAFLRFSPLFAARYSPSVASSTAFLRLPSPSVGSPLLLTHEFDRLHLGHLLEGRGLGVPKPLEELEEILGLAPGEGQGFLAWARGLLGIDVRSRCTNPNLPEGSYLVPYPFPTLSERSVMARKPLFCQEGKEP